MGTRGCVAIGTDEKWRGVYNHWDSYPTGLGRRVWLHIRKKWIEQGRDPKEFPKKLLEYGDWREYLNDGVCKYCGKKLGQPCNINGIITSGPFESYFGDYHDEETMRDYFLQLPAWRNNPEGIEEMIRLEKWKQKNLEETGYIDPDAKYHQHSGRKDRQITNETADPLFLEWIYVIDPSVKTMTILTHVMKGDHIPGEIKERPELIEDGWWDYGHCAFKHIWVTQVSLRSAIEPDWEGIEELGRQLGDLFSNIQAVKE